VVVDERLDPGANKTELWQLGWCHDSLGALLRDEPEHVDVGDARLPGRMYEALRMQEAQDARKSPNLLWGKLWPQGEAVTS